MSEGRPLYPEQSGSGWDDAPTPGQDGAARYGTDSWQGVGGQPSEGQQATPAAGSQPSASAPYANEPSAMAPRAVTAQGMTSGVPSWRQNTDEAAAREAVPTYGGEPTQQRAAVPAYGGERREPTYGAQSGPAGAAGYGTQAQAQTQQVPRAAGAVPPNGVSATQAQRPQRGAVPPEGTPQATQAARQQVPTPQPPAHASERSRRGGGVRTVVLSLVFGALGALGVVFALRQFGLLGTTTVLTETPAGQTLAINTSGEDATIAKAVAAKVLPSVVSVHVTTADGSGGMGSGVILDTDGNIITNNHVAGDAATIAVTIDGKSYEAELVGTDASSDLAVIKADLAGAKVTPVEIGDSDALAVGDWVATVGSPFGLDQSVSAGIVSSLSRNELMTSSAGRTVYANLIQTDASINPGNSGGALVNDRGQLVGISTLFSSDTQSFAGIGFAIPGNYAIDVATKIINGETVTHAYIGLSMQTVNAQNAQRNNLPVNQGAYVAEVAADGPAAEAGIEQGDIIVAMNDQEITSADGMILAVRAHKIGETVKVAVMRGQERLEFDVTLGSDESLQQQQQQLIDEQEPQVDGMNGTNGNGSSEQDILEQLYEYFYNNRGGSYVYDLSE